jgi:glucose/arabinose dehydrogenase
VVALGGAVLAMLAPIPSNAAVVGAVLPPGFTEKQIASSPALQAVYGMEFSRDGRLWVIEQNRGNVRIVKSDQLLTKPFLHIDVDTGGSRGLISIAFHPNFPATPHVWVNYTTHRGTTFFNRVSRFTANGDVAVAGSEVVVWEGDPLEDKTMHFGGAMWFGTDGKLYITTGDRLRGAHAQQFTNTWGKILRINPDGTIPTDNPFLSRTSGKNRAIWALGLRNPWQISRQKSTGRVFISDVGAGKWEELNEAVRGANYGWPIHEGSDGGAASFRDPIWAYHHSIGSPTGCTIVGGDFYDSPVKQLASQYWNTFIVGDHCEGWVKSVDYLHGNVVRDLFTGVTGLIEVRVGSAGQLYYLRRNGALFRVDRTGGAQPLTITQHPQNQTTAIGGSATFSVSVSGGVRTPSYQWRRNGVAISGATGSSYTLTNARPADDGAQFRVRVTDGTTTLFSNIATLNVTSNHVPTAAITMPPQGTTYVAGQTIQFAGTGTDQEDGTLAASRFTWEIVFHHNTHTHDFILPFSGRKTGQFTIPTDNETDPDVWYRIHLTVTDSQGARTSVFRDIRPRTSVVTLRTSPAGLRLTLDDSPVATPHSFTGVEGIVRRLGAPSPQTKDGVTYVFVRWSDGGTRAHAISTPTDNTTYTATFSQSSGRVGAS